MLSYHIEILRTPEEVRAALREQRIAACPVRSRTMWAIAYLCHAALMIPLPCRVLMMLLPNAGIYAYSENFTEWRAGWASYVPPSETISASDRAHFLARVCAQTCNIASRTGNP